MTQAIAISARLYWENKLSFVAPRNVAIPVAVSVFPDEIYTVSRVGQKRRIPNCFITIG